MAPTWNLPPNLSFSSELFYPELQAVLKAGGPELQPYEGMAAVWNEYSAPILPHYATFLAHLASRRGFECRSVLDLACGTGILTSRLSRVAGEVIGLDASEMMLDVARIRHGRRTELSFIHGDFRKFELGRQFDAAFCASNSLNYLADSGELVQVFTTVAKHLQPGGVFVFDLMRERGMRSLSGHYLHALAGERRFAIHFDYDRVKRRETARVILRDGIETHRRIPLGEADVLAAVVGTGLEIEDYFSSVFLPWGWNFGCASLFVVLSKMP
jgi:SAM-dependent methyltransferase